jgi:uncharacterized protein (DUF488 family)
MTEELTVFTIGHSTHPTERFLALLHDAGVTAVADVRSAPYSRRHPHFNKDRLEAALRAHGVSYVFLGKELGGRPAEPSLYCEGVADYEKMAQRPEFNEGLDRVVGGAGTYRIALMCSEGDPMECHRCLLVSRALAERGVQVKHILPSGDLLSHAEVEDKLLALSRRAGGDLFAAHEDRLAIAYRERARKFAFAIKRDGVATAKRETPPSSR